MNSKKLKAAKPLPDFYRAEQALRDSRLLIEGTKKLLAQSKMLQQNSEKFREKTPKVTSPLWKSH
jgi:hypothetical protein